MLPQGYTRVEYIESTGTQKINTNVIPDASTVLDITFECKSGATTEHAIFGASWSINGFFLLAYSAAKGLRWHTGGKSVDVPVSNMLAKHRVICSTTSIAVDGTQYTVNATQANEAYPIELFSVYHNDGNYGNKGVYRLYPATIQQGGTLVRDYIPCIDANGDANLWDDVNETLAEKVGTFIAGPAVPSAGDFNTLLLLHGNDGHDASLYRRIISNNGVAVSEAQSKFGGKSLYFDGSSYLRLADIDILPENGDFTIDWWEYRTVSSEGSVVFHQPVKAKDGTGTIFGYGYQNAVNVYMGNMSGSFNIAGQTSMGAEVLNQWVHRAVVRSGSTFYLFADGVLQNTITSSAALARNITPYIGRYDSGNYLYYKGYIDELRISDVARWTSNFTPPTAEYNPIAVVPEAPSPLVVKSDGRTVTLTWNPDLRAEKYCVYRDCALVYETTSTEHIDTIADSPAAHVYAVTAVNEFGESDFSEFVRADIWGDTAPELIYDRTQADVDDAKALISKYMRGEPLDGYEQEMWERGLRGCYNTSDVNRVEYHTRELQNILNANGYNIHIDTQLWAKPDIMRYSDIIRYLGNIKTILDAFGRSANAPELPSIDRWIDYIAANDIEKILYVTRELIYGALAIFRRAGTFRAGGDYLAQVIRRA